ncbi:hook-length control protein FliK [Malonomonas rubra DSM 5091]|uniref:Hook-length control protein FliK n=1 Tax=Malonomonas rubra DSM 5091 TaxID=1122189 RepID=A0A1M6MCT9_MALRU|nr:flagellar hook-length control protein FliK [Malonomonas rubra]SHJ81240.1 hook-length control protein FliK [Malonomonas rubra DSM 5091]
MQAMSMIDMGTQTSEMMAPAKPVEPQSKEFGKVLNEQRRAEHPEQAETKPKQVEKQAAKQEAKTSEQPAREAKQQPQVADQGQQNAEPMTEKAAKLQQTVVNLMKVIAGGETPELVEEFGSSEELLQQLVQQLEGADLQGEQVLAGIDFSALAEQLQNLTENADGEQLTQLAEQLGAELSEELDAELNGDESLLENAELAAGMMNTETQGKEPKLVENLAQARQILQKAIDSVATAQTAKQETAEQVVVETEETAEAMLFSEETAEEVDPRFAGLLKPRGEQQIRPQNQPQQGLRQRAQGETAQVQANTAGNAQQVTAEAQADTTETADFAEMLSQQPKQNVESLVQQAGQQAQPNLNTVQQQAARVQVQTPTVQLPSGQQVAESQIFDQVVTRFVGSQNGESGRMVLRLQPAELGSLKIELQVEGDRVRANLHAQSIQVQEVLERNLPQLRNALAEQGLKIDQFNVDVDRNQDQGQFEQMAQEQQQRQQNRQQSGWQQDLNAEEQIVPLAHLMQNGGGGISLHV